MIYETIVIGGGPAAMSAIIYLSRFKRKVAWVFGYSTGGQLQFTEKIENYLGFTNGEARHLLMSFNEQTSSLEGVDKFFGNVLNASTNHEDSTFLLETDMGESLKGKTVLIATGAAPRKLGVKGEEKTGVSYCAICDAPFYVGKEVVVVGGGQSAIENAEILSRTSKKVILIHRKDSFSGSAHELDELLKKDNVHLFLNAKVSSIKGGEKVERITIEKGPNEHSLRTDAVFVSIGNEPSTDFLKGLNNERPQDPFLSPEGYIVTSSLPLGVFAAGDVVKDREKQVIIAAGDGAHAAIQIEKYLQQGGKE